MRSTHDPTHAEMATSVRAYAGQVLEVLLCGGTNVTVASPGLATVTVRGPGGACASCANRTFALNRTITMDYALTPRDTPCGAFDPHIHAAAHPSSWAAGGPPITCVSKCSADHVVGGDVVLDQVSFMASLQIPDRPGGTSHHFCGGSLIGEGIVLTAAHCVAGDLTAPGMDALVLNRCTSRQCITAVVGAIDSVAPENAANRLTVVEWVAHPLYDKATFAHDVGLLRVAGDYDYAQPQFAIGPWSHPAQATTVPLNANVAVLGWGVDEHKGLSRMLRNATMPSVTHATCAANYAAAGMGIAADALCAGAPYRTDACAGDSGGPLLLLAGNKGTQFGAQVGIVSNGVTSCKSAVGDKDTPGVYAATADPANAGWIMQQLAQWNSTNAPPLMGRSGITRSNSTASSTSSVGIIAGAAGGGCAVAAVLAFFGVRAYRRRQRVTPVAVAPAGGVTPGGASSRGGSCCRGA